MTPHTFSILNVLSFELSLMWLQLVFTFQEEKPGHTLRALQRYKGTSSISLEGAN